MRHFTNTLEGFRYEYRWEQSPQRQYEPVLLIGGAFQTMDSLRRFASYFAARTDVVLIDPPGSGASDALPAHYGADFLAQCVKQTLDRLCIQRVNLIGVSFGTAIAYRVAQLFPERVANMVLVGTMSHADERIRAALGTCTRALEREDMAEFSSCVSTTLLNHERRDEIENFRIADRILRSTTASMTSAATDHFRTNAARLELHRRLETERPPTVRTLVFTGEHDQVTTPAHCRQVAATIDGACFVLIENADHLVPLERPGTCTALADTFLRGMRVKWARECRTVEYPR